MKDIKTLSNEVPAKSVLFLVDACYGGYNVLDIVALANCVLAGNCNNIENGCAGDMNADGGYNVLDIVSLANCVLAGNC